MTLVSVNRIKNHVSLTSDSRISFGSSGYFDFGVKIFPIQVRIYGPTQNDTNSKPVDFEMVYGLGAIGSSVNANTIKEIVAEVLQNLQYVPGYTEVSMDAIADIVFKIFSKITLQLGQLLRERANTEFVFTGFCPQYKKVRIFHYSCKLDPMFAPVYNEILLEDGILYFGSGADSAKAYSMISDKYTPMRIIRKVIKDANIESVGGSIQYGQFESNNFKIYGVLDYELDDDGNFHRFSPLMRGIDLEKEFIVGGSNQFQLAYTYKVPFQDEIIDLKSQDEHN